VSNDRQECLLSDVSVNIDKLGGIVDDVKTEFLKPIATAFASNVTAVHALLTLPHQLAIGYFVAALSFNLSRDMFRVLEVVLSKGIEQSSEPDARNIRKMLTAFRDSVTKLDEMDFTNLHPPLGELLSRGQSEGVTKDLLRAYSQEVVRLVSNTDNGQLALRVLLTSTVSGAWTAFECLATDTWVAALNARPARLAQKVMDTQGAEEGAEGLMGKQIPVGLLAKHGFDLRGCMGHLLKPKFDPTSLPKIKRAYTVAFGNGGDLTRFFDAPELAMLEASRHLIVHRAGVVDEEFEKKAAKWGINHTVGVLLPLDGKQVCRLANAAIDAGCKLLSFVDGWMESNPA
jgi:hypothetical protein